MLLSSAFHVKVTHHVEVPRKSLCLHRNGKGNGPGNEGLYAIILLASRCIVHETLKGELNEVRVVIVVFFLCLFACLREGE